MREFANRTAPGKDFLTITGLKEAERLFAYMASSKKNVLVKKSYGFATKKYRAALRRATPKGTESKGTNKSGKPVKRLKQTIGFERSRKYANSGRLVEPVWAGHLNKKGAFHNHLVVLGRKATQAKKSSIMKFKVGDNTVFARKVKATKPHPYVGETAEKYKDVIGKDFGDAFVRALDHEAKRILKKYYVA